jgi:opacity protein-like surface antigen
MKKIIVSLMLTLFPFSVVKAEPYVAASLGWTFNQKLSGIKGNENLDYEGPINLLDGSYFPGTSYSNLSLKDVLQGGVKAGYYFESAPTFGIELEANYSQPNMKRQNVTITNSGTAYNAGGIGDYFALAGGSGASVTEDQQPAKVQLLQFNLNALYRYKGFQQITPYIGAGPSLNIIRITGTGYSGVFVDPPIGNSLASNGPNVSDTSVNIGVNFKLGAEYKFDDQWGLGAEYHYTWVPVDISHFRSANDLSADLEMQSLSVVLTRHF